MNKQFVPSLENAFRCHIFGVKPRRNVYIARTDRGLWIIKGYKQKEKAEWVTQLAENLQEKGFFHTVQYLTGTDGGKILPYGTRYYTIMKAIDGREANHTSLYEVKKSAATLARFHQAAQGFSPPSEAYESRPILLDKWEGRLEQFERIARDINNKGPQNRLEQLIQAMAEELREDGYAVLENAYKLPLLADMYDATAKGTLAHRDVASHNFLITERGSCYLIDLDTVSFDIQAVDLVQYIGRMLLLQGYSMDAFLETIEAYSKVKYLSDTQIWMIHQFLRYPDNVLREVTGLYSNRPGYQIRGVTQLVQLEWELRRKRQQFLQAGSAVILQRSPWGEYHFVG